MDNPLSLKAKPLQHLIAAIAAVLALACVLTFAASAAWPAGETWTGAGTQDSPYLISSQTDLEKLATAVNSGTSYSGTYFKLTGDIALTGTWTPIGNSSTKYFAGNFDGAECTVSGLNVACTSTSAAGLFGYVGEIDKPAASISNLTTVGSVTSSTGSEGSAGVVGSATNVTITDCANQAGISANNVAGGIVGYCTRSTITGCQNTASVEASMAGSGRAGGLIGEVASCAVSNCYNRGAVKAVYAGGIAGSWAQSSSSGVVGSFSNCYTTGRLTAKSSTSNVGGIAAYLPKWTSDYAAQNTISNCYVDQSVGYGLIASTWSSAPYNMTVDAASGIKSDADMKAPAFAKLLGPAFKASLDYPDLAWEAGDGLPTVTVQPADATYSQGAAAAPLSITAEKPGTGFVGATGALTYQWYSCHTADGTYAAIEGASGSMANGGTATYTPSTATVGTSYYRCAVTNTYGEAGTAVTATSASAAVAVQTNAGVATPTVSVPTASYTFSQGSAGSAIGASVTNMAAAGMGAVTYQWYCSSAADGTYAAVAGASGAVASDGAIAFAPPTSALGTTYYKCTVTNTFESTKTAAADSAPIAVTIQPLTISTASELREFASTVNGGGTYRGMTVALSADIALDGAWTPIGTADHPFEGTFDGGNHTVSGLSITGTSDYQALFGYISGATVQNLVVAGGVSGGRHVAGAVAYAGAGSTVRAVGNDAAVASSYVYDPGNGCGTGGVVGTAAAGVTVAECRNSGAISAPACVGGVVGFANGTQAAPGAIRNCYNSGAVCATDGSTAFAGGILGDAGCTSGYCTLSGSYDVGAVSTAVATTSLIGAISGTGGYYTPAFSGNYYLEGQLTCGGSAVADQGSGLSLDAKYNAHLTSAEMLAQSFAATMGASFKVDEYDQNGGYPLLTWETVTPAHLCTYTFALTPATAALAVTDSKGRVKAPVSSADGTVVYKLLDGDYAYAASNDEYLPENGTFTVAGQDAASKSIALYGTHFTATFATAPAGATVKVFQGVAEKAAQADGTFKLLPGDYTYRVSANGYNTASGTFTMDKADRTVDVTLVAAARAAFAVTASDGASVVGAACGIFDSDGTALAADAGAFTLLDGSYTYQVDLTGYTRATGNLTVRDGKVYADGASEGSADATISVSLQPRAAWNGTDVEKPLQDASGTYLIDNPQQLAWFSQAIGGDLGSAYGANLNAKLTSDIALNATAYKNYWQPIGYRVSDADDRAFAGTFDGQGHTVSGLFATGADEVGLFGAAGNGATIKNVTVSGYAAGTGYVAGLVGYAYGAIDIQNCGSWVTVRGQKTLGGIIGGHDQSTAVGTVNGCFNKGSVTSTAVQSLTGDESAAAGIAGSAFALTVTNCYNTASIAGNGYCLGGIVGNAWSNTAVTNCYNTGKVAYAYADDGNHAYLNAFGSIVGAFFIEGVPIGTNSYWLSGTCDRGVGRGDEYVPTDQSLSMTSAIGLAAQLNGTAAASFADPADASFNQGYPRLTWENEAYTPPALAAAAEDGTAQHPWVISTYDELKKFASDVDAGRSFSGEYVQLAADITVDSAFAGIGAPDTSNADFAFSGTFDGRGHTVGGLAVSGGEYGGFFQNLRGATVRHLRIQGSAKATDFAGGLAGYASASTIRDCYVKMDVALNQDGAATAAGSVGGIVGRSYRNTLSANVFAGTVTSTNAKARIAAIGCASTTATETLAGNFYLAADGVPGGFSGGMSTAGADIAGGAQQVATLDSDELAWTLNTVGGTRANSGIWGNDPAASGGQGVCFADGTVRALYRLDVDKTGIEVSLNAQYAHEGDTVGFSNLSVKKGYELAGPPLVTSAGSQAKGDVFTGTLGAASGSFTMQACDATFSVKTTFDPATSYTTSSQVASNDAATRTATVAIDPSSGPAGTEVTVSISGIDTASRFVSIAAYENTAERTAVPLTVVGIGAKYTFALPKADAIVVVTLGDVNAKSDAWAATDPLTSSARHITDSTYSSDPAYIAGTVALDGTPESKISNHDDATYRSQYYLGMDVVESTTATKYQYSKTYSLLDQAGARGSVQCQGFLVYDYLVSVMGMPANLDDSTAVTFSNAEGGIVVLTVGDLKSTSFNTYGTSGDSLGYMTVQGVPAMLAYGQDGAPIPMDVKYADGSTAIRYRQNTPFTLMVGQSSYDDVNAGKILKGVDRIVVGGQGVSDQHAFSPYDAYKDKTLTINVKRGDSTSKVTLSVADIEALYNSSYAARERSTITGTQFNGASVIGDDLVSLADLYDGVDIWSLLMEKAGITASDLSVGTSDATVTFSSYGTTGTAAPSCTVPLEYLAGGTAGTYAGNVVSYGGLPLRGVRSYVAFGKNGYPIVDDANESGYTDYNRYGPLIAVLPYNATYGVKGYVDSEGTATANDARIVCWCEQIDVSLPDSTRTDLADVATVAGIDDVYPYTGSAVAPKPAVTAAQADGSVKTLVEGTDYDLTYTYDDDTAYRGGALVTITGKGRYKGTIDKEFRIAVDIAGAAVGAIPDQDYTGSAVAPVPAVTLGGKALVAGTDFAVTYKDASGAAVAAPTQAGTYALVITGIGDYAGVVAAQSTFAIVEPPAADRIVRLYGDGALDTMKAVVDEGSFAKGGTVVVATDGGYYDALTASALAGVSDGCVLLTNGGKLSSQTAAELKALAPSNVVVVGGPGAVSETVRGQIASAAGLASSKVTRVYGGGATDTADAIWEEAKAEGLASDTCIIATSDDFKDALSVAPAAYAQGYPIFLAGPHATLSAHTLSTIKAAGFTKAVVIGGTGALPTAKIDDVLKAETGITSVSRYWGNSCFQTSSAVANWEISDLGMGANNLAVATADSYPDALCGAALCGKNNAILVLAVPSDTSCIAGVVHDNRASVARAYLFGGVGVLPDATIKAPLITALS